MTFLNPLLLLGLIAASIPLLLHLLNLRKLRTVEFSSLRFLKELQKSKMRKVRLRQILLLILRTLLVVFAVLSFARPALQGGSGLPGARAATSVVILIDNSSSMDVRVDGVTRLALARHAAREVIDLLENNDQGWIVPMTDPSRQIDQQPSRSRDILKRSVDSLAPGYRRADLDEALGVAASILDQTETLNKELYVLTDAQRANVQARADSLKLFTPETRIYVLSITPDRDRLVANLGLDSIRILSTVFEQGKPVHIRAWIRNYGGVDVANVPVTATLNNGPGGTTTATVATGKSVSVDVAVVPRSPGPQSGYVDLGRDGMVSDNRRYFAFPVLDRLSVAVVGSPEANRYLSIAFSVMGNALQARILPPRSVGAIDMDKVSTIVVADAVVPDAARIAAFVEKGGGLVIYGGPGLDRNAFNAGLGAQLGIALGATTTGSTGNEPAFASLDRGHPLFAGVFDPIKEGALYEAPTIRLAMPAVGGQTIMQAAGGGSFMSEFRRGKGRVIYIAVPPTMAWSDFPARGLFLPVAIRSAIYVGSRRDVFPGVTVGEGVTVTLPAKGSPPESVTIVCPDGREEIVPIRSVQSGATVFYDNTDLPGVYRVGAEGKVAALFTVNAESGESALDAMSMQELSEHIARHMVNRGGLTLLNPGGNDFRDAIVEARFGLELWKYALVLAILCAFSETIAVRSAIHE